MTAVRAFVGHSFSVKDRDVVRCFTDYFDTLKNGLPDFDWAHATEPRPDGVPTKVLELVEGKNLFIGICTKNERVSKDNNFTKSLLGGSLNIAERELVWKTSDWIIQEIGLAIGKGMKLILLLEDGVRIPGGLFGDLAYISFLRENPEQAFQNLTGMINSVSNDGLPKKILATGGSVGVEHRVDDAEDETADEAMQEPEQSWDKNKYLRQHIGAVMRGDEARAKKISDAYLDSVGGVDNPAGAEWRAADVFCRLKLAKGGSLSEIEEIADANKHNSVVLKYTARAFLHYQDTDKAKRYFCAAAQCEPDPMKKVELLGEVAPLQQNGEEPSAVNEIRALISSPDIERIALSKLRPLDKYFVDDAYRLSMLEREIQIDPSDTDRRFELAFLHSNYGNKALALYHYLQIPEYDRTAGTWNNIGVQFREFDMKVKSTAAYKKSVKDGETVAMSNLAQIYMDAGFLCEAKELLSEAQSLSGCHENVASAQVNLNEIKDREDKLLDETLAGAPELAQFLGQAGNQLWQPLPKILLKSWSGDTCELAATLDGKVFRAAGSYEVEISAIVNALANLTDQTKSTKYSVIYEGMMVGRVIVGKRSETRVGLPRPTLIDSVPTIASFVIVVSEDGLSAQCMVGDKLKNFTLKP